MSEEPAITHEDNDLSIHSCRVAKRLHRQHIARPNRSKHAGSIHPDPHFMARAKGIGDKVAAYTVERVTIHHSVKAACDGWTAPTPVPLPLMAEP